MSPPQSRTLELESHILLPAGQRQRLMLSDALWIAAGAAPLVVSNAEHQPGLPGSARERLCCLLAAHRGSWCSCHTRAGGPAPCSAGMVLRHGLKCSCCAVQAYSLQLRQAKKPQLQTALSQRYQGRACSRACCGRSRTLALDAPRSGRGGVGLFVFAGIGGPSCPSPKHAHAALCTIRCCIMQAFAMVLITWARGGSLGGRGKGYEVGCMSGALTACTPHGTCIVGTHAAQPSQPEHADCAAVHVWSSHWRAAFATGTPVRVRPDNPDIRTTDQAHGACCMSSRAAGQQQHLAQHAEAGAGVHAQPTASGRLFKRAASPSVSSQPT